ncbi:1,4-alpha-glucan branching enzyme [Desulfitispora alkaliphila]|uniref:glycoside hydrolase family 57 protein n=1 Tax=Desulfitispora alkaliphila TaxID=622674 RepID=UPI003D218251
MSKGYHLLVLHAHLPYIKHIESMDVLEERWLYEAITETYIPLIRLLNKQVSDNIEGSITISISPTLISMLTDKLLQERYLFSIVNSQELAHKELKRNKDDPAYYNLAAFYLELLHHAEATFKQYDNNLITAFKYLADKGKIELITTCATHGFLPLYQEYPQSVKAQVQGALDLYQSQLGRLPRGMWLPECGYYPGLDAMLTECGLDYTFVESHGLLNATPQPKYASFAPVATSSGLCVFARDSQSSKQVWSAEEGYPGDPDYREFYRDIGYELPLKYLANCLPGGDVRTQTGFKYYRITGKTEAKKPYKPEWGKSKADMHAQHYMEQRVKQIEDLSRNMQLPPVILSPFDAELFGHWWFEGPVWLDYYMRKVASDQSSYELITPSNYLDKNLTLQQADPASSSWGANGYADVWLDDSNKWIYPLVHSAVQDMVELARYFQTPSPIETRALQQAAREVLLAQSSDWPFIIKTNTVTPYAEKRVKEHLEHFEALKKGLWEKSIDEDYLSRLEIMNSICPNINYTLFR